HLPVLLQLLFLLALRLDGELHLEVGAAVRDLIRDPLHALARELDAPRAGDLNRELRGPLPLVRLRLAEREGVRGRAGWVRRARLAELLDPAVARVSYVDVAAAVDGNAGWGAELAVPRAGGPPLGEEDARGGELLDPVVAAVPDVDVAGRVGG